ncbi:MAG: DUF4832 domain-containing protein [Tannerellaceae bacterium]|jgi:hypothetical protein|nr:DUF4832 domain-containing protein [Tannerellaceae bacterium]
MRKITFFAALIIQICCVSVYGQTTHYKALFADDPEGANGICNPERGFRLEVALDVTDGAFMCNSQEFREAAFYLEEQIEEYKDEKVSLVQTSFYLTGTIGREITEDEFKVMEGFFETLRKNGLKAILRFAYETGNVNEETAPTEKDIVTHTKQLRKILRENRDVILVLQAGFVGARGEWRHSSNGLEKSDETKKNILENICSMIPGERMVQIRTPELKQLLDPSSGYYSRVSYHDDFIAIRKHPRDEGLSEGTSGHKQMVDESQFLLIDGNLPWGKWSVAKGSNNVNAGWIIDGLETARRLSQQHYTSLGIVHNYKEHGAKEKYSMMYWKETPVTEKFLSENNMPYSPNYFRKKDKTKVERSVFEYIRDHLGYRIELQKFKTNKQWNLKKKNRVELSLVNRGFATLFNEHAVYFVLIDANDRVAFRIRTQDDVRFWHPHRPIDKKRFPIPHTVKADIVMEGGTIDKGTYKLGLWMPDESKHLMFDSRYAIRCANSDVEWWVSPDKKYGVNILTTITF